MSWRDKLLGKQPEPGGQTSTPPPQGRWGGFERKTHDVGSSLNSLWTGLRGKQDRPQLVCREGHVVRAGHDTCEYGHYVG